MNQINLQSFINETEKEKQYAKEVYKLSKDYLEGILEGLRLAQVIAKDLTN
jgi:hypothetical protein